MTIRPWYALALLSCAGCLPVQLEESQPAPPKLTTPPAVVIGPVTPDQVHRDNAQQMAESLRREMEQAGNE